MKIDIICSDKCHPIYPYLEEWMSKKNNVDIIGLYENTDEINGGEILFLISCSEIVSKASRHKYQKCFVIHASDLPKGRGWSPHVWQILEGKKKICISLIEANDPVDSGRIWKKEHINIAEHFDFGEICHELFSSEIRLMDYAIEAVSTGKRGKKQVGEASYYKKRTGEDSRLDINKTIREQFNVMRVADPDRYPTFFDYLGFRYQLVIKKVGKSDEK